MSMEHSLSFSYTDEDFVFSVDCGKKSKFDKKLHEIWQQKILSNCFRYKLEDLNTKYLPGKYNFVSQLNVKRAVERRKPQFISSIAMPFNPEIFHFGKVSEKEVLFTLKPEHWKTNDVSQNMKVQYNHTLIINVSPIEECHSLLVPNIQERLSQVLNRDGLRLAVETLLISSDSSLRMGFNSLGAYASVNHLHLHLYYLRYKLLLENVTVNHLIGHCYELIAFPAEGFAFQITNHNDVAPVIKSVIKLIEFLIKKEIPHNIFLTRGTPFVESNTLNSEIISVVRIFVWARKAVYGSKNDLTFNPAVCELAGHIIVKDAAGFETITEDYVADILNDACHSTFMSIKDEVKNLFA